MDYDACRELQRELVYRLQREVTFYRSLYVLITRQRDAVERGSEAELAACYGDLNTIMGGLRESQFAISEMRKKEPGLFDQAIRMAPVPELVGEASEILGAARLALKQGTRAARQHYERLRRELAALNREHEVLHAYKKTAAAGRYVDGTR